MSSITYNLDIPDAPNNPSVDQPKMKVNTNATSAIMAVDHYTFAESNAGTHRQVDFPSANAAGTQTGAQLTIYTAPGTASSASSQLFWKNSNGGAAAVPYPLGIIKAWAYVVTSSISGNPYVPPQSSNITNVQNAAPGLYSITIATNALASANYGVLITPSVGAAIFFANYNPGATATAITLTFQTIVLGSFQLANPSSFTFQILQI